MKPTCFNLATKVYGKTTIKHESVVRDAENQIEKRFVATIDQCLEQNVEFDDQHISSDNQRAPVASRVTPARFRKKQIL